MKRLLHGSESLSNVIYLGLRRHLSLDLEHDSKTTGQTCRRSSSNQRGLERFFHLRIVYVQRSAKIQYVQSV